MISQSELRNILIYDPVTGVFTWNISHNNRSRAGDIAGYIDDKGYILINIYNITYKAHRLAFLYVEGEVPKYVDHRNRIRSDNTWVNLRLATHLINGSNTINNNEFVGVSRSRNKWKAYARGKHLGIFKTHLAACMARHNWNIQHG